MKRVCLVIVLLGLASGLSAHRVVAASDPDRPSRTTALVERSKQAGGTVTHRFKHVNGIAAEVPDSAMGQIERLVGPTTSAATS